MTKTTKTKTIVRYINGKLVEIKKPVCLSKNFCSIKKTMDDLYKSKK